MSFSSRITYSYSLVGLKKGVTQFSHSPNMLSVIEPLAIKKDQRYNFVKIGIAFSYRVEKVGNGIYLESKLQDLFLGNS